MTTAEPNTGMEGSGPKSARLVELNPNASQDERVVFEAATTLPMSDSLQTVQDEQFTTSESVVGPRVHDPPPPARETIGGGIRIRRGEEVAVSFLNQHRRLVERVKGTRLGALGIGIPPESNEAPAVMSSARERADDMLFIGNYQPYRSQMRAFALPTFGDGYLRLNLVGREREGTVSIHEYDDERRAMDALVTACRDARTGEPVVEAIQWLSAQDALDPEGRRYADGIIEWARPTDAFDHPDVGTIGPFPLHRTGTHQGVGFLWASGPGIAAGDLEERSALDLPPTILRLLDRQAPPPPAGVPISAIAGA